MELITELKSKLLWESLCASGMLVVMALDVARSLDSFPDILHPGLPRISSASTRLPVFLATAAWKC